MTGSQLKGLYMMRGVVAINTASSSGMSHKSFKMSWSSDAWGDRSRAWRSNKL